MNLHAKLHKIHTALSFHKVHEAIATKVIRFYHINRDSKPADILSMYWGILQIWGLFQPLLLDMGKHLNWEKYNGHFAHYGE